MDFIIDNTGEGENAIWIFEKFSSKNEKCRPVCRHYTKQQPEVIMEAVWIHKVRWTDKSAVCGDAIYYGAVVKRGKMHDGWYSDIYRYNQCAVFKERHFLWTVS